MIETFVNDWLIPYLFVIGAALAIVKFCAWRADKQLERKCRSMDPRWRP